MHIIGGDAVVTDTVPEVIVAIIHSGLRVSLASVITDLHTG